jgi:hypothetical protein
MQDNDNAIKALSIVYNEYPKGYTVNLRLGWLCYLNANYANSIQYYKTALKISPSSIEAKLGYILPLIVQNRYDDVESNAYQILKTDHYNYYANLRLVYALRMQEKHELSEKVANKMLLIYPTDINFLTELALTKMSQDEDETATRIFTDILTLDPENQKARLYLQGE